ncbi:PD-(D/E)XK nuclease family protein [Xanthomonas sacchari]|uniref:PD-(D/E)XK nuclease family protein n=1 Tax=Xanthomonas sacchari TaxID=56458 RepID=UPI00225E66A6|nr:PD-(D/E)XK nuclease family protein [Xanthomonas sacchari]
MALVAWLLVLIAGGAGLRMLLFPVGASRSSRDRYAEERAQQPAEIASGSLVLSEFYLRCDIPRKLGARVDQVYRTPEAVLVPVDTKVRYRREVRFEDVVELSVQASVLRHTRSPDRPYGMVASWGYVRVAPPDGGTVTYLKTPLLDDTALVQLYERHFELLAGAPARPASAQRTCVHCPQRGRCPTPAS